ncbi:hypothetical protein B0H63DRAFT_520444 [Podospora didyma]|uniref:Uncharacterized protein n=1 Tax=Podospora didyma TaxID=330526 RepID=A0AAE0U564_9PEZI|nr:hypothetical protein B0H63DRAFT_520444 [Podospora didyma]
MKFTTIALAIFAGMTIALPADSVERRVDGRECPGDVKCSLIGSADLCDAPCVKCGFEGGYRKCHMTQTSTANPHSTININTVTANPYEACTNAVSACNRSVAKPTCIDQREDSKDGQQAPDSSG